MAAVRDYQGVQSMLRETSRVARYFPASSTKEISERDHLRKYGWMEIPSGITGNHSPSQSIAEDASTQNSVAEDVKVPCLRRDPIFNTMIIAYTTSRVEPNRSD
jgi:hypothetical protein